MINPVKQFSEILSGPLGELIASIGKGVGEAQAALDEGSMRQTLELYKTESKQEIEKKEKDSSDDEVAMQRDERRLLQLIRSIGYQPTFYVIPETEVEAKVSLNLDIDNNQNTDQPSPNRISKYRANVTPLNANNINQYNLNANAAATLKFKIVPVPSPSGVAEKRIMPYLVDSTYDDETIEFLESLGLNYKLDKASQELFDEKQGETFIIKEQNIVANKIIDQNTELILVLKLK